MKFDYIIGNPPYQDEAVGDNKNYNAPIYDKFLDSTYEIADCVEMIHPARFLFNAGGTKKEWNEKMLKDPYLKVLNYYKDSTDVFMNTDIKGGVAITYHNINQKSKPIEAFIPYPELNNIKDKVFSVSKRSLMEIVENRGQYRFSDLAYKEQPDEMAKVTDRRISSPVFIRMPDLFLEENPNGGYEYIQIYGNTKSGREYRWFRKDYLAENDALYKYKVMVPKAIGSGAFGETLSTPLIGKPAVGHTETFISIGKFETEQEAEACLKYIKTKLARAMFDILKVTQNNNRNIWQYVPLQDFTSSSDIDWSESVDDIDKQLYKKYGLSEDEIEFIESHVEAME